MGEHEEPRCPPPRLAEFKASILMKTRPRSRVFGLAETTQHEGKTYVVAAPGQEFRVLAEAPEAGYQECFKVWLRVDGKSVGYTKLINNPADGGNGCSSAIFKGWYAGHGLYTDFTFLSPGSSQGPLQTEDTCAAQGGASLGLIEVEFKRVKVLQCRSKYGNCQHCISRAAWFHGEGVPQALGEGARAAPDASKDEDKKFFLKPSLQTSSSGSVCNMRMYQVKAHYIIDESFQPVTLAFQCETRQTLTLRKILPPLPVPSRPNRAQQPPMMAPTQSVTVSEPATKQPSPASSGPEAKPSGKQETSSSAKAEDSKSCDSLAGAKLVGLFDPQGLSTSSAGADSKPAADEELSVQDNSQGIGVPLPSGKGECSPVATSNSGALGSNPGGVSQCPTGTTEHDAGAPDPGTITLTLPGAESTSLSSSHLKDASSSPSQVEGDCLSAEDGSPPPSDGDGLSFSTVLAPGTMSNGSGEQSDSNGGNDSDSDSDEEEFENEWKRRRFLVGGKGGDDFIMWEEDKQIEQVILD